MNSCRLQFFKEFDLMPPTGTGHRYTARRCAVRCSVSTDGVVLCDFDSNNYTD